MIRVGEPTLVDDQARVDVARDDSRKDLVVAQFDDVAERGRSETKKEERRRLATGHGDPTARCVGERHRLARDDERADAAPERRAAPQQAIAIARRGGGAEAQLRQLELRRRRAPVQLLDVVERGLDLERRVDKTVRERVEGERVVRAGRVAEAERHCTSSLQRPPPQQRCPMPPDRST